MTLAEIALAFLALWGWAGLLTLWIRDEKDRNPVEAAMLFGPLGLVMVVWFWVVERK